MCYHFIYLFIIRIIQHTGSTREKSIKASKNKKIKKEILLLLIIFNNAADVKTLHKVHNINGNTI